MQQIVDENGTLRHIILSALNNNGSSSTTPSAAIVPPPPQPFPYGQAACGANTSPYSCCCCCYCSGSPTTPMTALPPPQPVAAVHNGILAFPSQTNQTRPNRRAQNRPNSFFSKRSNVSNPNLNPTINNGEPPLTKSPNKSKVVGLNHMEPVSKIILPSPTTEVDQKNRSNPTCELITNGSAVPGLLTKNSAKTPLQLNCKSFQPKPQRINKHDSFSKDNCTHASSLSVSPMSVDSSAGYASDKYVEDREFYCNGSVDVTLLPSDNCSSRTSSSSVTNERTELGNQHVDPVTGELLLNGSLKKLRSDGSDILSTDTELSTLEVSIDSYNESDSRNGSELNVEVSKSIKQKRLEESPVPPSRVTQQSQMNKPAVTVQERLETDAASPKDRSAFVEQKAKTAVIATESPNKKSPKSNQKLKESSGALDKSDMCKPKDMKEDPISKTPNLSADKLAEDSEDRIQIIVSEVTQSSKETKERSPDTSHDRRSVQCKSDKQIDSLSASNSKESRATSEEKVPKPVIVQEVVKVVEKVEPDVQVIEKISKPSPQRSPKHLLPEKQCLNLTYIALTATSVKLKWAFVEKEHSEKTDELKDSVLSLATRQYIVEMVNNTSATNSTPSSTTNGSASSSNNSPVPPRRIVYQGTLSTCRVAHLNCQKQYSFRVRTVQDDVAFVSNLLTITTPEQLTVVKQKKSKQQLMQQQYQQLANQQLKLHSQQQKQHQNHNQQVHDQSQCKKEDTFDPDEKNDQRCAFMILLLFTLSAVVVAVVIQQLMSV